MTADELKPARFEPETHIRATVGHSLHLRLVASRNLPHEVSVNPLISVNRNSQRLYATEAEIDNLDSLVTRNHCILWFQVSVNTLRHCKSVKTAGRRHDMIQFTFLACK